MDIIGHLHVASLPPRMRPRHPLNRRLGEILGRSDSFGAEKSLTVAENRNPDSEVPRVVSLPTEVLRHAVYLIFIGTCIVIYSYSTTNKMQLLSQIIYYCKTLYMFRTVFPSVIRSTKLRIQQWYMSTYAIAAGSSSCLTYTVAVYAVLSSWWLTERPSEKCRAFYKNK
jgi:hypothetical protein